jgi:hypothetical protein
MGKYVFKFVEITIQIQIYYTFYKAFLKALCYNSFNGFISIDTIVIGSVLIWQIAKVSHLKN